MKPLKISLFFCKKKKWNENHYQTKVSMRVIFRSTKKITGKICFCLHFLLLFALLKIRIKTQNNLILVYSWKNKNLKSRLYDIHCVYLINLPLYGICLNNNRSSVICFTLISWAWKFNNEFEVTTINEFHLLNVRERFQVRCDSIEQTQKFVVLIMLCQTSVYEYLLI